MKVVILAGGLGTRISEESYLKPKPMIEIGDMPIIWHIMKCYSHYGFHEFIVCAGYKQHLIKQYFADYFLYKSDITFDFSNENKMIVHSNDSEPWKVTIVDTGLDTMTGGRIKKIERFVKNETFMLTYGDGVSDVDVSEILKFHEAHGKAMTLTTVQPEGRFGVLDLEDNKICSFREKNKNDTGWVNAGYMVLNPEIFDYIEGDSTIFEHEPMEKIAFKGEMMAYKHHGFWHCMDTIRDKERLEYLWSKGKAPWRVWKQV